ncbi:nitrate- and nitrite sensing domain-containing protein [Dactylosporangium sp. NPDC051541]|uniref:sensor histidine kinase n=1 Tax=Dactylosporangium sp. NPDC051541 TaxID=3363977 RepID=UPI0037AD5978
MARHRHAISARPGGGGTINGRLTRILALPLLAVLVLLGVVVFDDIGEFRTARDTREAVAVAVPTRALVQSLQDERGLSSAVLVGNPSFKTELPPARKQVDTQRADVARLADRDVTGAGPLRTALAALSGLDGIRAQVDAATITRAAAVEFYTARITGLLTVDFGLDRSADSVLRRGYSAWSHTSQTTEALSLEKAYLLGIITNGSFKPGEYEQYAVQRATLRAGVTTAVFMNAEQKAQSDKVLATDASKQMAQMDAAAAQGADGRQLNLDPQRWWAAASGLTAGILELERLIGRDIQNRAQELEDAAFRRLGILLGIVGAAIVGAILLMIVAARSITRPLGLLVDEADALATRRLPDAVARVQAAAEDEKLEPPPPVRVPRRAGPEIQLVAEALDRVQATAYALATEQAIMRRTTTESLANLGRRNQNLLRRQIGFITKLEREESDPSDLANLFELDHLATRMRRNAESLLVLAGEESPRPWSEPLTTADVIRAAVSEVEDYRRVSLRRIDDAHVAGAHVSGLAHMIAELVENALAFSSPDVDVEIQGRYLGDRYLIAISDQGVGMKPDDLARANGRLRGEESFVLAPTRYLGHWVVGKLAQQMSVDVQLTQSPVVGTTARVILPPSMLVAPSAIEGVTVARAPQPAAGAPRFVPIAPLAIERAAAQVAAGPTGPSPTGLSPSGSSRAPVVVEYVAVPEADEHTDEAPVSALDLLERTRNGLVKRPARKKAANAAPVAVKEPAPVERPEAMDESPDQVRSRLTSLQAGVARGRAERATEETDDER